MKFQLCWKKHAKPQKALVLLGKNSTWKNAGKVCFFTANILLSFLKKMQEPTPKRRLGEELERNFLESSTTGWSEVPGTAITASGKNCSSLLLLAIATVFCILNLTHSCSHSIWPRHTGFWQRKKGPRHLDGSCHTRPKVASCFDWITILTQGWL